MRDVTVPVGENRRVPIEGFSPGPFKTSISPEGFASARADEQGSVLVSGIKTGGGLLAIEGPDGSDQISITVAKYAGRLTTATPTAEVTGSLVPAAIVSEAAWRAARAACSLEPGASASMTVQGEPKPMGASLTRQTVPVQVRMDGPAISSPLYSGSLVTRSGPHSGSSVVLQQRSGQVKRPGFTPRRSNRRPARLLCHHQNGTGQKLRISLMLINTSDQPARVRVPGLAPS